ncbi:response regulator receiver protein [Fimbriimonas ginsengisoli Gsoil 348]|uniref:Response regulator receiver protein n=2 Tax=Fimbriimonas ginsengisoli TaxID=1005039 RepID=A0A068NQA9_FIMGI|nr:response regulator receiver protein [Fimbriimonas ginsengisoli Gsoil 348]
MTYLLRSAGYRYRVAVDGQEGIDLAREELPDLVLCDIHMPVLSGYEVAKQFKQDARLRDVPIVAVTAYAMVGDREQILSSGFDMYIAKPIKPETFIQDIETMLSPERVAQQL